MNAIIKDTPISYGLAQEELQRRSAEAVGAARRKLRELRADSQASQFNIELAESEPACIAHPQARLNLVSTHGARIWPQNFWTSLRTDAPFRFDIEVHNLSDVAFAPYGGKGAVNLSYQWLDKNDRVVRDGVRTPLAAPLQPGDSVIRPIVVDPPFLASLYHLRVSLVQEGCSWFYRANPSTGLDVPYQ